MFYYTTKHIFLNSGHKNGRNQGVPVIIEHLLENDMKYNL